MVNTCLLCLRKYHGPRGYCSIDCQARAKPPDEMSAKQAKALAAIVTSKVASLPHNPGVEGMCAWCGVNPPSKGKGGPLGRAIYCSNRCGNTASHKRLKER